VQKREWRNRPLEKVAHCPGGVSWFLGSMARSALLVRVPRCFLAAALFISAPAFAVPETWKSEIEVFTTADVIDPPVRDAVVFVGGSSIRQWTSLSTDFSFTFPINRGFGDSELADIDYYVDRIVIPYHPRFVVLYAGDDDLNAGKSPETVLADFQAFCARLKVALPQARIIFLSIKESPSRAKLRPEILRTNTLIAAECAKDPLHVFVDVATPLLDAAGKPRPELFAEDQLHLKPTAYAIWAQVLTPFLRP
jgi:GDSL-like Lipase/Acylhydrolase family